MGTDFLLLLERDVDTNGLEPGQTQINTCTAVYVIHVHVLYMCIYIYYIYMYNTS